MADIHIPRLRSRIGEAFAAAMSPKGKSWLEAHPRYSAGWGCIWTYAPERIANEAQLAGLTVSDVHPATITA